MLQSIRDGIQGWVSALIIGVICVPFAFWGVTSYFTGGGEVVVADVDGGEISQRAFQQAYQSRFQAEQRRLGNAADLIDQQALKLQVLEGMVSRESLTQHVLKSGYNISDEKLVEALRNNPYLQQDGQFSQSRYGQLLAALGMDAATYEESLRRSLRVGQLQTALSESSAVSEAEVVRLWKLQNQAREVAAVTIKAADLSAGIEVSEEDIKDWYEDHSEDFYSEERVRVNYVELTLADLTNRVEVSEEDIASRYEEDKERYVTPEQRRARHILIAGDGDDVAKERLKALKARLEAGEDFAELAKSNSDDPGSAVEGGDLGWVGRGVMVKPFEDALFDLDTAGDLSGIVETQFGVHLIQLDEIQDEQGQTLAEASAEIETNLRNERAETLYVDMLEQLSELSYENPEDLQSTADELELNVRVSGWFTRERGTGVSVSDRVRDAAFSSTVLDDNENSEVIELGDERAVVVRKLGHEPAVQKSLASVSDDIEQLLKNKRAQEQAQELAEGLLDTLDDGAVLADAAKEKDLEATDLGAIKRSSSAMNAAAVRDVFALPRPKDGELEAGLTELVNGDVVIYQLSAVTEADSEADSAAAELASLRNQLEAQRGRAELFATLRDIRENTDVTLHTNRL